MRAQRSIEVKDRWMKVSVSPWTLELRGMSCLDGMFPRVKLERKTSPKRLVAANGEQNRDLGEKTIKSRQTRELKYA